MSREDLLAQSAQDKLNQINQVKKAISNLRSRAQMLKSQPVSKGGSDLRSMMKGILRPDLMPGNVGQLNEVTWTFYHQIDFDLSKISGWPTFNGTSRQTESFTVTQESAVLLTGISRNADDYSLAGDLGPWEIEIKDRQSSRFFNNQPIPIQSIGTNGFVTPLPVSMLVMPNSQIEITMSNFLDDATSVTAVGETSGIHQFTFHGYRIRIEDAGKILSTIFKG